MAERKQPRRWVFFALDTVPPAEDGALLYRWAQRPMVYQAFPAFIEGRVPVDGWLDIVRAASSTSGEYNIDHGAVLINDADALIRSLLDEYATQWFLKRQGHLLLLSDAAIRDSVLPPRILFCGPCSDVQVLDNRTAQLDFEDVLSRFMDREYPQYTLGDAYPYLFVESEDIIPPADLNTTNPEVQIPKVLRDQVIPTIYGPFVESRVDPLTGLAVQQRMCPVYFMGFLAGNFGDSGDVGEFPPELADLMSPFGPEETWGNWGELVVCSGEEQIPDTSVSDLLENPKPVLLSEDRYGVDVMAPGHSGWPFVTNSVLRNGYRLTVIYARGPVLWQHITGICPINVDVCGWPDEDDVPIDQAFFGWQSFIDQHVLAHDGAGYTGGPQTGLTMFDPTVDIDRSMIWTSHIQTAQAVSAARLETDKGYLLSMGLWKKTPLREILRKFNVTFDAFTAKNSAGQVYEFLIDDLASPDDGVPIRERIELLNLPAPRIDWSAIENEIDYTVGYDPKLDSPRTITITVRNQDAIDAMKGDVRKVQGIRDLGYTSDDATATDTIGRRLMRLKQPPRYQTLPMRTDAVDRELGEQIRVTHQDGFGPNHVGYALHPMVLMKSTHHGDHVTMEALDVRPFLVTAFQVLEDEGAMVPVSGAWDIGTAYSSGDIVTVSGSPNGGTWLAVRDTVAGEEPGVSDAWVQVAETDDDWFNLGDETSPYPPPIGAYELR